MKNTQSKSELIAQLQTLQQRYNALNSAIAKELADNESEKLALTELIGASEKFIQFTNHTPDYNSLLKTIITISCAKYASLNIFEDNGLDFTTVAILGIKENITKALSILGFDIINKHWKHDPIRAEKTKLNTITQFNSLHELTSKVVSKNAVLIIEKTFGLGEVFVIKIAKDNKVLGDFTLMFNKGETLLNTRYVNLYANQVGMFLDRSKITNKLRVSDNRHTAMISNISDVIGIIGVDGLMKYKSSNIEKWFGWSSHELIGTDAFANIHPTDLEKAQKIFYTLLEQENSVKTMELQYKCKNGTYKPIELTATNLANDHIINGILINYHDITERKLAEDDLRKANEKLRTLSMAIDQSPITTVITDIQGNIEFVNPKFIETTGYTFDEAIGQNPKILKTDLHNKQYYNELWKTILSGENWHGEFQNKKKNGEYYWESAVISPVKDTDGTITHIMALKEDITERKRAEEELRDSEDRLNRAEDIGKIGNWEYDLANNTLIWSYQIYKLFERDPKLGPPTPEEEDKYYSHNDRKLLKAYAQKVIETGEPIKNYEFQVNLNSGRQPFFNGSMFPEKDKNGTVVKLFGAFQDITERKLTEQLIRESETKYRQLFHNLTTGFALHEIILDNNEKPCDYRFLEINPAFEELTGLKSVDLIGKTNMEVLPNTEPYWIETYGRVALTGIPINFENFSCELNKHYQVSAYSPEHGKFATIFLDITERKHAEEALRVSEEQLRAIAQSANDAIITANSKGLVMGWNRGAEKIFGYTEDEIYGKELSLIMPKSYAELHNNGINRIEQGGEQHVIGATVELEGLNKFGNTFPVELSLARWKTSSGEFFTGIIRDITARKLSEEKLMNYTSEIEVKNLELDMALFSAEEATATANQMAAQAELANKSKSMFLANMSHEIRTPLNAIIGFSQLMSREPMLTNTQKEYNTSIIHAGEHLLALINDILELSKVEAGRVVLNPATINLHTFLKDIQMIFKERTQSKLLQFNFEIPADLPHYVIVDESKLRQIFINLIGNAVKFTDEGSISVRTRVAIYTNETSHLIFDIQDTGPGIPESEIGNLFKHFVQTTSGIKAGSGTGLGLALSRELSVLMGGNITVTSEIGVGTIFTVVVEIQNGESIDIEDYNSNRVIGIENNTTKLRILVVDDKKENLQVVVSLLNIVGFETAEAMNGQEAIEKFEQWNPHLILMDMRMPIMDGYEATALIKATDKGKQTPIIALTASTFEEEKQRIETLNMHGYIRKPFRESELFSTIGKILDIKYIYEEKTHLLQNKYITDDNAIITDIAKLPNELVSQMAEAVAVADMDLLTELIKNVETISTELAQQLKLQANNYNYEYLQKIFR